MIYRQSGAATASQREIIQEVRQLSATLDQMLRERMAGELNEEAIPQSSGASAVMLRLIDPADVEFIRSVDTKRVWAAKMLRVRMFLAQVRNLSRELGAARREASLALTPEFWERDIRASLAIMGLKVCAGVYLVRSREAYGWSRRLVNYLPQGGLMMACAEGLTG